MYLYYFNSDQIDPLKLMIVRIISDEEYEQLLDNMTDIFEILINDNLANKDNILIFSLIKENKQSIENISLPFSNKNLDYLDNCIFNEKIIKLLEQENCKYFFEIIGDELHKNIVDYNMNFLIDKYI